MNAEMVKEQKENMEPVSGELFQNPPAIYRGAPFWAWNCVITDDAIRKQIGYFKEMGMGGFHIHSRTGMSTEYLSDTFLDQVRLCVDLAKKNQMLCWLYDEDRYASGYGGGYVTKDPAYRERYLALVPERLSEGYEPSREAFEAKLRAGEIPRGYFLRAYRIVLRNGELVSSEVSQDPDAFDGKGSEGALWYAYLELNEISSWWNNQTYVNTLDKKAIERFVEVTHERYASALQEEFGISIPAIFTDEPQFMHMDSLDSPEERRKVILPFTDDFPETYKESCGLDFYEILPQILWELPEGQPSKARYCYHNHLADRFVNAYAATISDWCSAHGIAMTGHMKGEETLKSQTVSVSEVMRSLRHFHIPGHDVLCDQRDYATAKMAQSTARQYGRRGALSEMYGVTNWDFDFRGHKLQGDWQAAMGITVRVHHVAWMSMKGEAKRDYPASIQYQSPWYKEYPLIEDHFARVNTAMTAGKGVASIGVIHPIESFWVVFGPKELTFAKQNELEENYRNITNWLLGGLLDFDFISEALLAEQAKEAVRMENGKPLFVMGEMAYETVILPGCHTLRSNTIRCLKEFAALGGRVLILGRAPYLVDGESAAPIDWPGAVKQMPFERAALLEELEDIRQVDVRAKDGSRTENLVYQLRKAGNGIRYLFLAHATEHISHEFQDMVNSTDYPYVEPVTISIRGKYKVKEMDTLSGSIKPYKAEIRKKGEEAWTRISYLLPVHASLLLELDENGEEQGMGQDSAGKPYQNITPDCKPYDLEQPYQVDFEEENVVLLDMAEYRMDEEEWQPEEDILKLDNILRRRFGYPPKEEAGAQPWTRAGKKGRTAGILSLRFRIHSRISAPALLAMESPEAAAVYVNGEEISKQDVGWFVDEAIRKLRILNLKEGENEILLKIPYSEDSNIEACYLLGDFGVEVFGRYKRICRKPERIFFGDICTQGYPFYAGNMTYHSRICGKGKEVILKAQHFRAPLLSIRIDGREAGKIAFAPYMLSLGVLPEGEHELEITVFGNRYNTFGQLHNCDPRYNWVGSCAWRTTGDRWSYEYQLKKNGIYCAPHLYEIPCGE